MNSVIPYRVNLTVINVILTALLVWLTASFLNNALTEREQANHVQTLLEARRLSHSYLQDVAQERHILEYFVQHSKNNNESLISELETKGNNANFSLEQLIQCLIGMRDDPRLLEAIRLTSAELESTINVLRTYRVQTNVYRDYTLQELELSKYQRDPSILSLVHHRSEQTVAEVFKLLDRSEYLPSRSSTDFYRQLGILRKLWSLMEHTSELDTLAASSLQQIPSDASVKVNTFRSLETQVLADWNRIQNRAETLQLDADLLSAINTARNYYYTDHDLHLWQVKTGLDTQYDQHINPDKWIQSVSASIEAQTGISDRIFDSLENKTTSYYRIANWNSLLNTALLIICALVGIASLVSGRQLKKQAISDNLTGLLNRRELERLLNDGISQTSAPSHRQAVIFLDLNRFKQINDNHGHAVGDKLLIELSNRLTDACHSDDLIARLGGDEFAIYCRQLEADFNLEEYVKSIQSSLNSKMQIDHIALRPEVAIGYAVHPDNSAGGLALLKNADMAMYRNKRDPGASNIFRFNSEIRKSHEQRLHLEEDLQVAIDDQQFTLVYQPKVATQTEQCHKVEALIRWEHPERGVLPPNLFIPVAEEMGLLSKIGDWVLHQACHEIKRLQDTGIEDLGVAVNISASQFHEDSFLNKVMTTLESTALDSQYLELEVTESIVMTDIQRVTDMLAQIRLMGVTVAVDDFGTGYSCLQYLQDLPLDTLKIDRAFILQFEHQNPEDTIANTIVQLGRQFDLMTVAEGVETSEQLQQATDLGVDYIQGYYYSKPVVIDELAQVISNINDTSRFTDLTANRAA